MKNLKTTTVLTLIMALILPFAACKKDGGASPGGGSSYNFLDKDYKISAANEKHLAGDIFLEFTSGNAGDYLQISFAGVDAIPEGVLTYHADRFVGYNAQTNFWATGVGLQGNNIDISGGSITVTRSGDNLKVVFNIDTANGKITGEYNGTPQVTN